MATTWVEGEWPFANVAYPCRAQNSGMWDAPVAASISKPQERNQATAEGFIDAFYRMDKAQLDPCLADETTSRITYFQGWAESGKYKVVGKSSLRA